MEFSILGEKDWGRSIFAIGPDAGNNAVCKLGDVESFHGLSPALNAKASTALGAVASESEIN